MKVVQLNALEGVGGAARAAALLHRGLRASGVESLLVVQRTSGRDPTVIEQDSRLEWALAARRSALDALPLLRYRGRTTMHWSVGWCPSGIGRFVRRLAPDIAHLHWPCQGFVPVPAVAHLGAPVVWTLHDSWAFTGGCHVPGDCRKYREACGACPQLGSRRERDLSRATWERKRRCWSGTALTVVSPSTWLAECARNSSLFRERRVEVIPNGIDTSAFAPMDKTACCRSLGLPRERKILLFGAVHAMEDRNKGYDLLKAALQAVPLAWQARTMLLVFGTAPPAEGWRLPVPVQTLGVLQDDASLRLAYSAADVCILPSRQENLPTIVLESMACGTPVVAFRAGGTPDIVEHDRHGYLASPYDAADLARGIETALRDEDRLRAWAASSRSRIVESFSAERMVEAHVRLYNELLMAGKKSHS
jgi:glycosyltransferase involved in cell wall biosynthesis